MTDGPMMLGVPEMDADHLEIAELFGRNAASGDEALPRVLDETEEAIRAHFAREEELMARHDVPVLFCHIAQHKKLMAEFTEARADLRDGRIDALRFRLKVLLPELVLAHVASVDRVTSMWIRGEMQGADLAGLRLPEPAAG